MPWSVWWRPCEAEPGPGGGKLMFLRENGGSAADSQHLATEMLVRLRPGKRGVNRSRRSPLTLDPALLTAGGQRLWL